MTDPLSKTLPGLLEKIAKRRILVFGDVMLDHYLWGDSTRISPEAPVQVVHIAQDTYRAGGAANVANNIAALGAKVELVGAVGADANGRELREVLKASGVEFDARFADDQVKTITKSRVIARNQQLCRLDREEAPGSYRRVLESPSAQEALERKIAGADGVVISDYAKGMVTSAVVGRIREAAHKHGKFVAFDPKPANAVDFSGLDLVTPNRKEALELCGLAFGVGEPADLPRVAEAIRRKYRPRDLVVTLGDEGMFLSHEDGRSERIPTAARQVYDVSGAGDTVIAALALARACGASLRDAADFANAAAGVVVGKLGTATVTPRELADYLAHP